MEKIAQAALIFTLMTGTAFSFLPLRAADQVVIRRQASEEYRNPDTGLIFPSRVDAFEKVMVRINPDPEIGVCVSYEDENGSLADVYIYQNADPFGEHAEKTFRRILDAPKQSQLILSSEAMEKPGTVDGIFCARFRMTVESEALISRLFLFEKNGYYVKIRITSPETIEQEDGPEPRFSETFLTQINSTDKLPITSGAEK